MPFIHSLIHSTNIFCSYPQSTWESEVQESDPGFQEFSVGVWDGHFSPLTAVCWVHPGFRVGGKSRHEGQRLWCGGSGCEDSRG